MPLQVEGSDGDPALSPLRELPPKDATAGRLYPIPSKSMPAHTSDVLLGRLRAFEVWCDQLGVKVRGTRIERYRRYLQAIPDFKGQDLDRGIFLDPQESPMQHALDRYLYVLREVHELTWISQSLRRLNVHGVAAKLAKVVSGADFAVLDRNSESRNTQFELRIASYFGRAGFLLNLDGPTDIVATKRRTTYHVECKRIGSPRQLERRLKEAAMQLSSRLPRSRLSQRHVGLVAADVTKIAFTRNGLTMAVTPDHSRDIIQAKLSEISSELDRVASFTISPACALWLQIHIPSFVMTPPMPVTRFSNLIVRNERGGARLRREADRFWRLFSRIDTREADDTPARPLLRRTAVHLPVGTRVAPDMTIVDLLVATQSLPDRPREHVVLSVLPLGGDDEDRVDFSFFELQMMFDALSLQERRALTQSRESVMTDVALRLLLQRFPYRGVADWLDGY